MKELTELFEKGKTYILLDTDFIIKAGVPMNTWLPEKCFSDNTLKFNVNNNNYSFSDLLNDVFQELNVKAIIPESVALEVAIPKDLGTKRARQHHPRSADFLKLVSRGEFSNITICEDNGLGLNKKNYINNTATNAPVDARAKKIRRAIKYRDVGDIAILEIIDANPDANFFALTGNNLLGINLKDFPNASGMNFAGFYTSLSEGGLLTKLGFNGETLPTGNEIMSTLKGLGITPNIQVVISEKFEKLYNLTPKTRQTEVELFSINKSITR